MKSLRILLCIACLAISVTAQDSPKFREYADAVARIEKFSGTVLVARKGVPAFEQSYGLADRSSNAPNTNATEYRIGSMSKSITGTAIMALRDQGKLKIEDSICVYVAPCPADWKPITLQHLLTHTSGVADIVKFPDFMEFRSKPHTPQQLVSMIAARPVEFAPGSKFVYSNSNFILLGSVIEKASGMGYEDFLKKNIFAKAGMKSSGYTKASPGAAKGYV